MKELTISVITPSYNQGQYIEETIQSVISQNYQNLEYIIIDGGSSDNTIEVIKKYEEHITYWISEKDSGQSEAINKGFKRATGDIVCWINSDDILMPGALDKVANFFENNKDVDILKGYTVVIDHSSNILFNLFMLKQKKWYAKHGVYYIAQPSMFWKRSIFETIGLLREDFHTIMDKELLIRMFKNDYEIGQLKKILAGFRIHETSKTFLANKPKSGALEKSQRIQEATIIGELYGCEYVQKPKLIIKLIYGFEKLFNGLYLKSWLFSYRWKGRTTKELSDNSSYYL